MRAAITNAGYPWYSRREGLTTVLKNVLVLTQGEWTCKCGVWTYELSVFGFAQDFSKKIEKLIVPLFVENKIKILTC